MTEGKIRQILVERQLVGIVGLDEALAALAPGSKGRSDDEIRERLLEIIAVNNYIPDDVRDAYGRALLREFKLSQGLPVEPQAAAGMRIIVLGMGCARCDQLESDVRDLLSEMKIAADLQHITEAREIARFRVMHSPALVINNKVLSAGTVPPKSKIREWIIEEYNRQGGVIK